MSRKEGCHLSHHASSSPSVVGYYHISPSTAITRLHSPYASLIDVQSSAPLLQLLLLPFPASCITSVVARRCLGWVRTLVQTQQHSWRSWPATASASMPQWSGASAAWAHARSTHARLLTSCT